MAPIRVLVVITALSKLIPCCADVITDWNRTASSYVELHAGWQHSRALTMVHVAPFDAVNAVLGGYAP